MAQKHEGASLEMGVLQKEATRPLLCKYLRSVDVGAVNDRPRAINNRPYGFY